MSNYSNLNKIKSLMDRLNVKVSCMGSMLHDLDPEKVEKFRKDLEKIVNFRFNSHKIKGRNETKD